MICSLLGQRLFRANAAKTNGSEIVSAITMRWASPKGRNARAASMAAIKSIGPGIDKHYRITQRLQGITSMTQAACAGKPSPQAAGSTGTASSDASIA
jgi:hypothetical protein